jgi:hypothetical protein
VRRTVIALLPRLAHFQPEAFISGYLSKVIAHLIAALKGSTDRPTAFMALGSVAVAVGPHNCGDALYSQLDDIVALLKDGLTSKRTKPFCPGAVSTLAPLYPTFGALRWWRAIVFVVVCVLLLLLLVVVTCHNDDVRRRAQRH